MDRFDNPLVAASYKSQDNDTLMRALCNALCRDETFRAKLRMDLLGHLVRICVGNAQYTDFDLGDLGELEIDESCKKTSLAVISMLRCMKMDDVEACLRDFVKRTRVPGTTGYTVFLYLFASLCECTVKLYFGDKAPEQAVTIGSDPNFVTYVMLLESPRVFFQLGPTSPTKTIPKHTDPTEYDVHRLQIRVLKKVGEVNEAIGIMQPPPRGYHVHTMELNWKCRYPNLVHQVNPTGIHQMEFQVSQMPMYIYHYYNDRTVKQIQIWNTRDLWPRFRVDPDAAGIAIASGSPYPDKSLRWEYGFAAVPIKEDDQY